MEKEYNMDGTWLVVKKQNPDSNEEIYDVIWEEVLNGVSVSVGFYPNLTWEEAQKYKDAILP